MSKRSPTIKKIQYKVSIKGLKSPKGSITFSALRRLVEALSEGSERALRLALEGQSVKRGRLPDWLSKSTDFLLTGIRRGSTTLVFEAPTLGAAAGEQIAQQDLWNTVPNPDDTALTILSKSVADAEREDLDSERYDPGVLNALLEFRRILDQDNVSIKLVSDQRRRENFSLDNTAFQKIEKLKIATPEPQAVLVAGFFNMIQHSQRKFELTLETGGTVRGRIDEQSISIEQMRSLWGKKVTIKGILHFTASKKPRLLEAQVITPRQAGDELLNTMSLPLEATRVVSKLRPPLADAEGIVSDIWGKWPGEESIDEILNALKEPTSAS